MSDAWRGYTDKNLMVIFCYAPAGLGHLRVMDALRHGLPGRMEPLLLGSQDDFITFFHRLTSVHPILRAGMEWMQKGKEEIWFSRVYRGWLRRRTKMIEEQVKTILDQRLDKPEQVLMVATHFGLAQQIGAIKEKMARNEGIKIRLVVQVTDDSPQRMWYVPGADLIMVPSERTKRDLIAYGKREGLPAVKFMVVPYPVDGRLGEMLSDEKYKDRVEQVSGKGKKTKILIPISGAAVGLSYFTELVDKLRERDVRYEFVIVARSYLYTEMFLGEMLGREGVSVKAAAGDREVVDLYEKVVTSQVVGLEITKPSEQAFKALICTRKKGGAILLFSKAVGRQEYDNLDFLRRHRLLPDMEMERKLWRLAEEDGEVEAEMLKKAEEWRGLVLPEGVEKGVKLIDWGVKRGLFTAMMKCEAKIGREDAHKGEMGDDGVEKFWAGVRKMMEE